MREDDFKFDLNAKRVRIGDEELLSSLKEYAKKVSGRYFSTTEYDKWENKKVLSDTISARFGSWKKALKILGIIGGKEFKYTPEELIANLEDIWRHLGCPPGNKRISKLGLKISEQPYKRIWGGVRSACEYVAKYHAGQITKKQLLEGRTSINARMPLSLNVRYAVLKRDNFKCIKCGCSPSSNHTVELEVDHIKPVAKGGTNETENLQTLCKDCNQGKKDKE